MVSWYGAYFGSSEKVTHSYEVKQHTMKRLQLVLTAILILALGSFAAQAAQDAQSETGVAEQLTVPDANAVSSQGGNVTENNVSSAANTGKWQGFWGTISGSLALGDGADNQFYNWTGITFQTIYATPNSAGLDWGSLAGLSTNLDTIDGDYGFITADADSIDNTLSGGTCDAGAITGAAGVTPFGTGAWETCIGEDTAEAGLNRLVFGTAIASGAGFNGDTIDYQLMVPAQAAGTDYYFFLEI